MMKLVYVIILALGMLSCSEDEFTRSTITHSSKIDPVNVQVQEACSNFSPPPVDILLMVDNTFGVNFLKANLRKALESLVVEASKLPDYRIFVAPLIPNSSNENLLAFQLITNNPSHVPTSAQVVGVNQANLEFYALNVSQEHTFDRALKILEQNSPIEPRSCPEGVSSPCTPTGDTVFRKNAFTMVVKLSNGDENHIPTVDSQGNPHDTKFSVRQGEFLDYRSKMNALQFRYITVVNHSQCGSNIRNAGVRYRSMSRALYLAQGLSDSSLNHPDSYDLCTDNLSDIFQDLAQTIASFQQGHVYNYWPVEVASDASNPSFDPEKLQVIKRSAGGQTQSVARSNSNGFSYAGHKVNHNIRKSPAVGMLHPAEEYTGFFIKLHGNALVEYPDCLIIRKEDFDKFYGYIVIPNEPDVSTLEIVIDGVKVDSRGANRWEYIGFKESQNVLVTSRSDLTPREPGLFRSGYAIKLFGNSIYTDGANVEVFYKSQPIN